MSKEPSLIHANFIFLDEVSASDPTLSTKHQLNKIRTLNEIIQGCAVIKETSKENYFVIPGGDGMCMGFFQGIDKPLMLAIEISKKLEEYNKGKFPVETIQVRIGINAGNCFSFTDLDNNKQFWGSGIIIAKRVMDLGGGGHILLSQRISEDLRELSDEYRKIVKPVRDYDLKHGIKMLLYSAYGENFGNTLPPTKQQYQKSHLSQEIIKIQNSMLYPSIDVKLHVVNSKSMLVHYTRKYLISNISDKPIKHILHGIGTDVPVNSINDLNLKVYEKNGELKISSVNLDKPFSKEFSTAFTKPLIKNEQRTYTIEYTVEEPKQFYENSFFVDCQNFTIRFSYPEDGIIKQPMLYDLNIETDSKTPVKVKPTTRKDKELISIGWEFSGLVKGQALRLEW